MKTIRFHKNKYGIELLMDLGTNQSIPQYFFEPETHQTDFFEIVFFSQGNGHLQLNQQQIDLQKNTILFISPYQKRSWFTDKKKISAHFLAFQESFLNDFFADKLFTYRLQYFFNHNYPLHIQANDALFDKMLSVFNDMQQEIQYYQFDSPHLIRALLYFILTKLNRAYSQTYNLSTDTQLYPLAYKFKRLMEENFHRERQIEFYTNHLNISRISLNKLIKKQFGVTVSEMINHRILSEIKDRLKYSEDSIAEVAHSLHFSEPNHMSRFFKQQTQKSPSEFRSQLSNW